MDGILADSLYVRPIIIFLYIYRKYVIRGITFVSLGVHANLAIHHIGDGVVKLGYYKNSS